MKKYHSILIVSLTGLMLIFQMAWAITPEQLKAALENDAELTVIDVRHTATYRQGHIPGAINIPAAIIDKKRLPAIGRAVVYGDGIRSDLTRSAVANLNSRDGILAEILEGGFPAWETIQQPVTREKGLHRNWMRYLTYQELEKAAANSEIVLVELRSGQPENRLKVPDVFSGRQMINLSKKGQSSRDAWDVAAMLQHRKSGNENKTFVLIGSEDGESEKVARRLHAAGIKQVAILIGGQEAVERRGRTEKIRKKGPTTGNPK